MIEFYEGEYGTEIRFIVKTADGEPLSLVDAAAKLLVDMGTEIREIPLIVSGDELVYIVEPDWSEGRYNAQIEIQYPSTRILTPTFIIHVKKGVAS